MRTVRRSLRRAWQMITWTLSGHIIFALATGIACGIVAARYPEVISPPYPAILGTLVIYPVMVAMWWRLHRPGGSGR
jgi:predicted PurR-regulated permease PerM